MYQEMSVKDALRKYIAGREVLVLEKIDGKMDISSLGSYLENTDLHFLVNVPAVKNSDIEEVVNSVVAPKTAKTKRVGKKIDDTVAMQMLSEGKTQKEMCERFGVTASAMSVWVKNHRPVDEGIERTQCETCNYHATEKGKTVCRYEKITGKKRDCKVEECRKWREV